MATPVLLYEFSEDEPFSTEKLNVNFSVLVSSINALAGEQLAQFGDVSANPAFMPVAGGTFLGQIAAPSALVSGYAVLTTNDAPTPSTRGGILQTVALTDVGITPSAGYVQAEAQKVVTKLDALVAALRTSGIVGV